MVKDIKQKATKGVAWTAVGNWGSQITTFIVFIILTRLLQPEDFGLVAMATVFTSFVAVFAEQGLGQAIVQRDELAPEHLDTAFWTNIILGAGLTGLGVWASGLVARIYAEPALQPVVAALSATFLLTALSSTQQALLQRAFDFRALSTRQLVAAAAGGIAGIVMAVMGAGVYALVGKTLITGLVGAMVLWRASDWRPRWAYSRAHFHDLFGFGMSMVGVRVTNFFRTRLDDFLIGIFLGAQALGYYTVAYRLGRLVLDMFTGVMSNVAVTTFARLQNDHDRLRAALHKITGLAGLITFPIFTGLAVLAADFIVALSGAQWLPSVPAMRILSVAGFSLSLQYFLAYLIISLGKPHRLFALNLIVTLVTAIAFAFSARYGIVYVALAYAIVNVSFYAVYLAVAHRLLTLDLRRYLIDGWRFLIPSLLMGAVVYLLNVYLATTSLNLYLRLALSVLCGALLYTATVFFFYRAIFVELRQLLFSMGPFARRIHPQTSGNS